MFQSKFKLTKFLLPVELSLGHGNVYITDNFFAALRFRTGITEDGSPKFCQENWTEVVIPPSLNFFGTFN